MHTPHRLLLRIIIANLVLVGFTVCLGLWKSGNPSRYFGEGRFTTGASCLQLLAVAACAFGIFMARRRTIPGSRLIAPTLVWLLVGVGFVFLACDDAFQIHEDLDHKIQAFFQMRPTALGDHIDDALIAFYGLIGLAVLWICRREVLRFRPEMQAALVIGFIFLALSVACDALAGDRGVLLSLGGDATTAKWLDGWFSAGDGAFMLLGEGSFLAGFYSAWLAARSARTLPA